MTTAPFPSLPGDWTPSGLSSAALLDLGAVPVQPGATALVNHLAGLVSADDPRKRRPSDAVKLHRAVGAVVGGTLREWRKGRAVFRSREKGDFTGELVGARQFIDAVDYLVQLGFLVTSKAMGYAIDFGDGQPGSVRRAARLRPTPRLLDLANEHGIGPDNVREEFGLQFSTKPPKMPSALVAQRPLKAAYGGPRAAVPVSPALLTGAHVGRLQRLSDEVRDANVFVAGFEVRGLPAAALVAPVRDPHGSLADGGRPWAARVCISASAKPSGPP